jgi:excisionase family DNA binding protein
MENVDFMTVPEVAKTLRLSQVTINRLIHKHELKALRFGKVYRIPKAEVERFLSKSIVSKQDKEKSDDQEKPSTVESLMEHFGTWAGGKEDAEKVLKYILENRVDAEF